MNVCGLDGDVVIVSDIFVNVCGLDGDVVIVSDIFVNVCGLEGDVVIVSGIFVNVCGLEGDVVIVSDIFDLIHFHSHKGLFNVSRHIKFNFVSTINSVCCCYWRCNVANCFKDNLKKKVVTHGSAALLISANNLISED